jgi:hypothetical protein
MIVNFDFNTRIQYLEFVIRLYLIELKVMVQIYDYGIDISYCGLS